jgi:hypothetical protein
MSLNTALRTFFKLCKSYLDVFQDFELSGRLLANSPYLGRMPERNIGSIIYSKGKIMVFI